MNTHTYTKGLPAVSINHFPFQDITWSWDIIENTYLRWNAKEGNLKLSNLRSIGHACTIQKKKYLTKRNHCLNILDQLPQITAM